MLGACKMNDFREEYYTPTGGRSRGRPMIRLVDTSSSSSQGTNFSSTMMMVKV